MQRQTTGTMAASAWRKLANVLALLAISMFVAHVAVAGSFAPSAQGHTAAHAERWATSSAASEPVWGNDHPSVVGEKHEAAQHGTLACCGTACIAALMPDDGPRLEGPQNVSSTPSILVSLLNGCGPDGPRRPPRLFALS